MSILRKVIAPFSRIWVVAAILVGLAALTAVRIFYASGSRRRDQERLGNQTVATAPVHAASGTAAIAQPVTASFGEQISNFVLPPEAPQKSHPKEPPPIPDEVRRQLVSPLSPISLFSHYVPPKPVAGPSQEYLPSFRLIRCELIGGPETGAIETPLIGIVLDDQYNIDADGRSRLVIPAGVEVHGTGKSAPSRDRIDGNGKWTLVWRTHGKDNGRELTVSALALNRDYDDAKHVYGDTEKSPGIAGQRFQSLTDQAIEEALLASVAAIARNAKSTASILNPLTSQVIPEPKTTIGNALLEGGAAGTDRIAQMVDDVRKQIDEKGYYVAAMPGKEFYLYTKEPIDLKNARLAGSTTTAASTTPHL